VRSTVTSYKGGLSVILDTNILIRLMESLNCEIRSFIRVIEERISCKCSLRVDVVIVEESFEEIESYLKRTKKCEEESIREKLEHDLMHYRRLIRFGGRQTKHKIVHLKSLEGSSEELKIKLGKKLYEKCKRALKNIEDDVDRSLIIASLVKAHEYSKSRSGGLVVLLTTDSELSERVASVASKIGLLNYIASPGLNDINKCLSVDCHVKCILERIPQGYAK